MKKLPVWGTPSAVRMLPAAVACLLILGGAAAVRGEDPPARSAGNKVRRELLKRYDRNGDGRLDASELAAARRKRPASGGATRRKRGGRSGGAFGNFRAQLTRRFDANDDGRLDGEELTAARDSVLKYLEQIAEGSEAAKKSPAYRTMLSRFDGNRDGKLDATELKRAQNMVRYLTSSRAADTDRKPAGGRSPQRLTPERRAALLRRFDDNKNGRLDPPELARLRRAMQARTTDRPSSDKPGTRKPGSRNPAATDTTKPRKPGSFNRNAILQRFDANKNGRLDPEERKKAQEAFAANRRRYGRSGFNFGTLDESGESQSARLDTSDALKRFDTDGDGTLDATERKKALEAARKK